MIPFVQVATPNVNVSGSSGWCLQYVDDAVKAPDPHRAGSAQQSWNNAVANKTAHPNEEPPNNVWVPVYYTIENGRYAGYGHVAWYYSDGKTTKIYDSEYASGRRNKPYGSGAELIRFMGWQMRYLGWSEVIDGVRAVKHKQTEKPKPQKPIKKEEETMLAVKTTGKNGTTYLLTSDGRYTWIGDPNLHNEFKKVIPSLEMPEDKFRAMFIKLK